MKTRIFAAIGFVFLFVLPALVAPPAVTAGREVAPAPPLPQKDAARPVLKRFSVDVVALKDGKPAADLTPSDFELYEDDKRVPIRSASFVPTGTQKRLAVVFHDMNLWIKNVQRDKDDITEELVALSKQGIEMMLMRLDSPGGLRIIQPFTRDEALIRKASASALSKVGMNESYEDLGGQFMETQGSESFMASGKQNLLMSYYYTKRLRFEKTMGGLMAACYSLEAYPGRKSILLVSGGIPDISSASQTDISRAIGDVGQTQTDDQKRATLDAIHDRAQQTPTRTRLFDPFGLLKGETFERGDQVLDRLIQFTNGQNVSIYALDPGVFTRNVFQLTSEFARPEEVTESDSIQSETRAREVQNLREISEGTSGLLFRGASKFDDLKKNLGSDLEGYYELAFKTEGQKPDGKFHKLTVKTSRKDVDLRFRKGYRDLTPEELKNMLLVSAYYSPELFGGLPLKGFFAPFVDESGKFSAWISMAMPVKPIFLDTSRGTAPQTMFSLYVWLSQHGEDGRGFSTKIDIPIKMTDALRQALATQTHIYTFFKGPELAPKKASYDVVYILQDAETGEIGGWRSPVSVPDLRSKDQGAVIDCVLGSAAANAQEKPGRETVALNPKNGTVEFGELRFYPRVTNRFMAGQDAWVFIQAYLPVKTEKEAVAPQFMVFPKDQTTPPRVMTGKTVAEYWNPGTKVWSAISQLGLANLVDGEFVLQATLPASAKADKDLTIEVRFTKGGATP